MSLSSQSDGAILALNAGSSSMKFAVFAVAGDQLSCHVNGQLEGIGTTPRLTIRSGGCEVTKGAAVCKTSVDALGIILGWLPQLGIDVARLKGAGHRIVHGGARYSAPVAVGAAGLAALDQLISLAPLHNGAGVDAIRAMLHVAPAVPQIACFDTAFHHTQPEVETRLALPRHLRDAGYRRYGFHGLNYEHVVAELPRISHTALPSRLLVFHLGNGCSICAIKNGQSVATTMGYSTLDGLVMGTRCGSIDPGVLIALLRNEKFSVDTLEELLYRKCGLLGLSGVTSDMKTLLDGADNPACREAVEHFCYWAARHAASALAAMGGVDAVVFTGGIGANAPAVRNGIVAHLSWLGLTVDEAANARNASLISPQGAKCSIWTMPADEEVRIARHVLAAVHSCLA